MKNIFEINKRPGSGRWLGLAGLMPIAATLWTAFGHLQSGVPLRDDRSSVFRASWYVRSGQWRADIRTLVAVVSYVMDEDTAQPKTVTAVAQLPEPVIPHDLSEDSRALTNVVSAEQFDIFTGQYPI